MRSVLLAPRAGFEAALRTTRRRARLGAPRPEGRSPYVLAAIGGGTFALLWLKVSPLAGLRAESSLHFRWSYLVAAVIAGALLMLGAQFLWGLAGSGILRSLGSEIAPRELRLVWGAAALPQVFGLLLLFPMDLAIVGPAAVTSVRLEDPLSAAWAALSVALSVALALWSLLLFVKGMQVAGGIPIGRALLASSPAVLCVAAVVVAIRFAAIGLAGALA